MPSCLVANQGGCPQQRLQQPDCCRPARRGTIGRWSVAGVVVVAEWLLDGCPLESAKPCSCGRASRSDKALLISHFGTDIGKILSRQIHAEHHARGMLLPASREEEIISKDSGLNLVNSHGRDPGSHEQSHKGHGEGASLWDRASVSMWRANCGAYLVVYD